MQKESNGIPLRAALVAPFIVLLTAAALLLGAATHRSGQEVTAEANHRLLRETANQVSMHLENFLKTPHQLNEFNARALSRGALPARNLRELERRFFHQLQAFPSVTGIHFVNAKGGLVKCIRNPGDESTHIIASEDFAGGPSTRFATDEKGNRSRALETHSRHDARTRPWYTEAVRRGVPAWSEIHIPLAGKDLAIAASRPVYDEQGELLGVASVDILLSHISRFLSNLRMPERGFVFIVERSGQLVASSTGERIFSPGTHDTAPRRLHVRESGDRVLRSSLTALTREHGDLSVLDRQAPVTFQADGEKYHVEAQPLQDAHGMDWIVGLVIPEAPLAEQSPYGTGTMLVLILAGISLTALVGTLASRKITLPVARLNSAALSLSKGERIHSITPERGIKELSQLTQTFNLMARRLQQTMESLEQEIARHSHTSSELQRLKDFNEHIVQNMTEGIVLTDVEGKVVFINPAVAEMLEASPEEITGKVWLAFVAEEERDKARAADARRGKGESDRYETVLRRPDGSRLPVLASGSPRYSWETGEFQGTMGVLTDISDLKRGHDALKISEQRWHYALEGAGDGVWDWNPQTNEVFFSRQWKAMLGFQEHEIRGEVQEWAGRIHPDDAQGTLAAVKDHLEGRTAHYTSEHRLRCKDGSYKWILDRGKVIRRSENGAPLRAIGTHADISAKKRAEEENRNLQRELLQSRKAESLNRMAGAIAHHFNNLLGVVMGNLELAMMELPQKSPLRENLEGAMTACRRASDVSTLMLTYLGQDNNEKTLVDLSALCREALSAVSDSLPERVKLESRLLPEGPHIHASPVQMEQVLCNLVMNAREAMENMEGRITVSVEMVSPGEIGAFPVHPAEWKPENRPYACLSIGDTGCGMTPEVVEKVFDPFFSTRFTGRGLGTSVALGIVKAHGGGISLESQPERGTTFRIFLPVSSGSPHKPSPETSPDPPKAETPSTGGALVMVVDDDPVIQNLAQAMFEHLGCKVATAKDGMEALEIFHELKDSLDCILLDVSMPGMSGWEVLAALKKEKPRLPVILCSGHDQEELKGKDSLQMPEAFLQKPYGVNDLKAAMAKGGVRGFSPSPSQPFPF